MLAIAVLLFLSSMFQLMKWPVLLTLAVLLIASWAWTRECTDQRFNAYFFSILLSLALYPYSVAVSVAVGLFTHDIPMMAAKPGQGAYVELPNWYLFELDAKDVGSIHVSATDDPRDRIHSATLYRVREIGCNNRYVFGQRSQVEGRGPYFVIDTNRRTSTDFPNETLFEDFLNRAGVHDHLVNPQKFYDSNREGRVSVALATLLIVGEFTVLLVMFRWLSKVRRAGDAASLFAAQDFSK